MEIYYDPLDAACKTITGAVPRGEELQLNLFSVPAQGPEPQTPQQGSAAAEAFFVLKKDGETERRFPLTKDETGWHIRMRIRKAGLYFYRFSFGNQFLVCGGNLKGVLADPTGDEGWFQLTVFNEKYHTPDWLKGGILYQIFPDRFCKTGTMSDIKGRMIRPDWGGIPSYKPDDKGKVRNDDFFGGTLEGIRTKLPYLKDLGVTAIYLNPIFEAASNHRYDTSDYMRIDPYLGTEQDLRNLTADAEKLGIRIILDGVFNHTGDDSVYFNKYGRYPSVGAYQSKDSPYYSWYTFQEYPDKYSSWWGIDILPELNENSESYQAFVYGENGVLRHWLDCGIGGYRLDVADELPDFFLKEVRKNVKETNPDAVIIGEVWEDASNKISYSKRREYLQGEELDSVMNYPLKDAIIHYMMTENAAALANTVRILRDHYPKQTLDCLMNILGTHDTARILTVLGGKTCYTKDEMAVTRMTEREKAEAIKKLKTASLLQYTLPGVPCVYYGDENGMEGYIDPFCRQCFDWTHQNEDLLSHYRKLGRLRAEHSELFARGDFKELCVTNGLFIFRRTAGDQSAYIFVNHSAEKYLLRLNGTFREYMSGKIFGNDSEIKPYSAGILFRCEPDETDRTE